MYTQKDFYSSTISVLQDSLKRKRNTEMKVKRLNEQLLEAQTEFVRMGNAQKLLSTVSDDNTRETLEFITSMVNKVLSEIFPNDPHYIKLTKKLYNGSKPHIIVELSDGEGNVEDMSIQTGTGLNQVISFMYVICLVEIRKGRRLIILDEKLNGLHKEAKRIISSIIEIFVKGGFQFIFVEYSLNDLGKLYNVEKKNGESRLISIEGDYTDDMVYIQDVDLDILDKDYVDEDKGVEV